MRSLTPTLLAILAFCPRALWLQYHFPQHGSVPSFPLVYGNATHEAFRVVVQEFSTSWPGLDISQIPQQIPIDVKNAISFVMQSVQANYAEFFLQTQRSIALLELALTRWGMKLAQQVQHLTKNGFTIYESVERVLPQTEVKLYSKDLGMHGRADQLYLPNGKLSVTDLKSDDRTTSFLHQEGHQLQVLSYGYMAEETTGITCSDVKILFTKTLESIKFPFNQKAITYLKNQIEKFHEISELIHPPPMLQGIEAEAKCPRCYHRDRCFSLANVEGEIHEPE